MEVNGDLGLVIKSPRDESNAKYAASRPDVSHVASVTTTAETEAKEAQAEERTIRFVRVHCEAEESQVSTLWLSDGTSCQGCCEVGLRLMQLHGLRREIVET